MIIINTDHPHGSGKDEKSMIYFPSPLEKLSALSGAVEVEVAPAGAQC
jgi:hypothetical protein